MKGNNMGTHKVSEKKPARSPLPIHNQRPFFPWPKVQVQRETERACFPAENLFFVLRNSQRDRPRAPFPPPPLTPFK